MKKKLQSLFFVLIMAMFIVPMMKSTAYADEDNPYINATQKDILMNVGDPVTMSCYLEDNDGSNYKFVWYFVNDGFTRVGTGKSCTINETTESDFYDLNDYDGHYYRVYYYKKGATINDEDPYENALDWTDVELYSASSLSCNDPSSYEVQLGGKAKIKASVYNPASASFEELGVTFVWMKNNSIVSNGEVLELSDVQSSDLGTYYYEVYLNGKKVCTSGKIVLEEREARSMSYAWVLGKVCVDDGKLVKTLPDGITFNEATSTFTLNNYNGTINNTLFSVGGDVNIKLIGENTVNFENPETYEVTFASVSDGNLNISGSGTLNLNFSGCAIGFGIQGGQVTQIEDCTINITSKDPKSYFYGYSAGSWNNYKAYAAYAALELSNATINIDSEMAEDVSYVNVGIDTQDSDLSIENSNININLTGGASAFGVTTGLNSGIRYYGGDVSIDDQSEIVVNVSGVPRWRRFSFCYYTNSTGNLSNTNIYGGDTEATSKVVTKDDFSRTFSRYDCVESYVEISPHIWTTTVKTPATTSSAGEAVRSCSHCSKTTGVLEIPKITTLKAGYGLTRTWTGKTQGFYVDIEDANGTEVAYKKKTTGDFKSVGKHTYNVTSASDYYSFNKTYTITINPAKATISKIAVGKKYMTVKMKYKVSTSTGGKYYQIAYKQKGTSKWKYTTTSAQSKTIKSLKKGKQYYVKVRAYKKVSGKTYYGSWSTTKTSAKIK